MYKEAQAAPPPPPSPVGGIIADGGSCTHEIIRLLDPKKLNT